MNNDFYPEYGTHITPEENIANWQFTAIKQREERIAAREEISNLNNLLEVPFERKNTDG